MGFPIKILVCCLLMFGRQPADVREQRKAESLFLPVQNHDAFLCRHQYISFIVHHHYHHHHHPTPSHPGQGELTGSHVSSEGEGAQPGSSASWRGLSPAGCRLFVRCVAQELRLHRRVVPVLDLASLGAGVHAWVFSVERRKSAGVLTF